MHVVNKKDFPSPVEVFLSTDSEGNTHGQCLQRQQVVDISNTFPGWSAIDDAESYRTARRKEQEKDVMEMEDSEGDEVEQDEKSENNDQIKVATTGKEKETQEDDEVNETTRMMDQEEDDSEMEEREGVW